MPLVIFSQLVGYSFLFSHILVDEKSWHFSLVLVEENPKYFSLVLVSSLFLVFERRLTVMLIKKSSLTNRFILVFFHSSLRFMWLLPDEVAQHVEWLGMLRC